MKWSLQNCARVVVLDNFCCDMIASNCITAKWNFGGIWIVMKTFLAKWAPGTLQWQMVNPTIIPLPSHYEKYGRINHMNMLGTTISTQQIKPHGSRVHIVGNITQVKLNTHIERHSRPVYSWWIKGLDTWRVLDNVLFRTIESYSSFTSRRWKTMRQEPRLFTTTLYIGCNLSWMPMIYIVSKFQMKDNDFSLVLVLFLHMHLYAS